MIYIIRYAVLLIILGNFTTINAQPVIKALLIKNISCNEAILPLEVVLERSDNSDADFNIGQSSIFLNYNTDKLTLGKYVEFTKFEDNCHDYSITDNIDNGFINISIDELRNGAMFTEGNQYIVGYLFFDMVTGENIEDGDIYFNEDFTSFNNASSNDGSEQLIVEYNNDLTESLKIQAPTTDDLNVKYNCADDLQLQQVDVGATYYQFRYRTYANGAWAALWKNSTLTTIPSYTISNLPGLTKVKVFGRVYCNNKWSAWSVQRHFNLPAVQAPAADDLSVSYNCADELQLTQTDTESTYYQFRYRTHSNGGWANWANSTLSTIPAYTISNLPGLTKVLVFGRIYCDGKWSAWSELKEFDLSAVQAPAPDDLSVNYNCVNNLQLSQVDAGASNYQFRYRTFSDQGWATVWKNSSQTTSPSIIITNLPNLTKVKLIGRVYCDGKWSSWSAQRHFNLPACKLTNEVANSFKLYPNPANDHINIELNDVDVSQGSIKIFNLRGKLVKEKRITSDKSAVSMDTSQLSSGMYLVRIIANGGDEIYSDKLTIAH